jgi:hypothetical protein
MLWFIKILSVMTILVFSLFSAASEISCVAPSVVLNQINDIPACRNSASVLSGLDNTFPTGAIFIGVEVGNCASYNFIEEAYRFLIENPELPTKLNLIVSDKNAPRITDYCGETKLTEILNDSKRVNLIPIDHPFGDIRWTQDWLQFVSSRGAPALFRLTYRGDTEANKYQTLTGRDANPSAQVAKACELPVVNHSNFSTPEDQGGLESTMGGNFDVIAGGLWGVGYDERIARVEQGKYGSDIPWLVNAVKTYQDQIKTIKDAGDEIASVRTDLAPVGHFDELFNVVKTPGTNCGFSILSASPAVAFKIMKEDSSQLNIGTDKECKDITLNGSTEFAINDSRVRDSLERSRKLGCLGLSGQRIQSILNDEKIRDLNLHFQELMDTNEQTISLALAKNHICSNVSFVRLPALVSQDYKNILPNLVNGLVLTPIKGPSTFISQRSSYLPFDEYTKKSLSAETANIKVRPVYDMTFWKMGGGFHCGSNTIPVCRTK